MRMKNFALALKALVLAVASLVATACTSSSPSSPISSNDVAFFANATSFSVEEQQNPLDSLFGSVNTNFYALNGSPLESSDRLQVSSNFLGQAAFRESNTGTLFSGIFRLTLNHNTGTGFGVIESLSVAHSNNESRFIDGRLSIVLDSVVGANYSGQVSGALSETALSPRSGLVYNLDGTIEGSVVNAKVDNLPGTRTLGVLESSIQRSTGDVSSSSGLFYANF